jgi:hypothetical protein
MKYRNRKYTELEKAVTLKVYTKCPNKWTLIDGETGEVYRGKNIVNPGDNGWEKLTKTK